MGRSPAPVIGLQDCGCFRSPTLTGLKDRHTLKPDHGWSSYLTTRLVDALFAAAVRLSRLLPIHRLRHESLASAQIGASSRYVALDTSRVFSARLEQSA